MKILPQNNGCLIQRVRKKVVRKFFRSYQRASRLQNFPRPLSKSGTPHRKGFALRARSAALLQTEALEPRRGTMHLLNRNTKHEEQRMETASAGGNGEQRKELDKLSVD